jgi:hypothetical protein
MRLYGDQIRYQDKYIVVRTKNAIYIKFWCFGNTWSNDEPVTVRGYCNYEGDTRLDDKIAFLNMIVNAIVYNSEAIGQTVERPDPYGTKLDIVRALRAWIDDNKEVLPLKSDINKEYGLSL